MPTNKPPFTITEKLVKIQSKLKAPKGQRNTFGNYNYRSCEDILNAVKPLATAEGLVVIVRDELIHVASTDEKKAFELVSPKGTKYSVIAGGDRFYIKATAEITDGEKGIAATGFAREEETKKGMDGSQITGASSSYARKYALNGLFAIDDSKDSDTTNSGQAAPPPSKSPPAESWIDPKNNAHKKIIVITQIQTKTSGENLVKELRKQFKISKANGVKIAAWEPPPVEKSPPPNPPTDEPS